MKCHIRNRDKVVDDYLMDILPKETKEAFEEHYFNCDECFQELRFKEEAVAIIKVEGASIFAKYLSSKLIKTRKTAKPGLFKLPKRLPAFVFASVFAVITLLGSYYYFNKFNSAPEYQINFDNNVPLEYPQSSLRGESENFRNDVLFNIFNTPYLTGISEYLNHEYLKAIDYWNKVESIALDLENKTNDRELLLTVRNYYFHLGVSHLAASVSQKYKLKADVRKTHNVAAIHYLLKADSLSIQHHFNNNDREAYFFAMASGLAGNKQKALLILGELTPKSAFYEDANKLISMWKSE